MALILYLDDKLGCPHYLNLAMFSRCKQIYLSVQALRNVRKCCQKSPPGNPPPPAQSFESPEGRVRLSDAAARDPRATAFPGDAACDATRDAEIRS